MLRKMMSSYKRVQLVSTRDKTDYTIDESGGLLYKNKLCIPNVMDLRKKNR